MAASGPSPTILQPRPEPLRREGERVDALVELEPPDVEQRAVPLGLDPLAAPGGHRVAKHPDRVGRDAAAAKERRHALVHRKDGRRLPTEVEEGLARQVTSDPPCLVAEVALVAVRKQAPRRDWRQVADRAPAKVEEATVGTAQEEVVRRDDEAVGDLPQRGEARRREHLVPVVKVVDGAGRVVRGDPLAEPRPDLPVVQAARCRPRTAAGEQMAPAQGHHLVGFACRDGGRATASQHRHRDAQPLQLPDRGDRDGGRPAAALKVVTYHHGPVDGGSHMKSRSAFLGRLHSLRRSETGASPPIAPRLA